MSETTKIFSSPALCHRPDSTQFALPTATQPCSPTCFRRLAWRWRREYRWPLDSKYIPAGKVHSCLWDTQQETLMLTTFQDKAILPLRFFPSNPLLCFSSFPSILNCQLSWASDHTDWSLHFFPGREVRGNLQISVCNLPVCLGSCLHSCPLAVSILAAKFC